MFELNSYVDFLVEIYVALNIDLFVCFILFKNVYFFVLFQYLFIIKDVI